jgi:hypothetical protein
MKLSIPRYAAILEAMRNDAKSRESDKRQYNRVDIQVKIQLATLTGENNATVDREFTGMTNDISLSGLGLMQSLPIEAGRQFIAVLPCRGQPPMCVICKSVFCRLLAESFFNVGALFVAEAGAELTAKLKALQSNAPDQLKKAG